MDTLLIQAILNGILFGGIYIAISIGLSLAFGVMHLINMAQGDIVMWGAYFAYFIYIFFGIDPLLIFPLAFLIFFILGYFMQKTVVRRVMGAPPLMNLVLFFGISIILANLSLFLWGPYGRIVTTELSGANVSIGGLVIPITRLLIFVFALTSICALFIFLRRTMTGMAIVAAAQDRDAAKLMGVNIEEIFAITLGIGFGTAAMSGALISSTLAITPTMGVTYTLFAFFITVLGGMGYLPGTIVGGLLLGLIQSFVITYYSTEVVYFILFLILWLTLLLLPKGIFGKGM